MIPAILLVAGALAVVGAALVSYLMVTSQMNIRARHSGEWNAFVADAATRAMKMSATLQDASSRMAQGAGAAIPGLVSSLPAEPLAEDDPAIVALQRRIERVQTSIQRWYTQAGIKPPEEVLQLAGRMREAVRNATPERAVAANRVCDETLPDLVRVLMDFSDEAVDRERSRPGVQKELVDLLAQAGLEAVVPARGALLDRNQHQPIGVEAAGDARRGTIAVVIRRGLIRTRDGTLLRPAEVTVYD